MSSKKKLVISLSVAAAVLVAAIIAIVAVFAATQQAVSSTIRVRYTADSTISGTASATYSYGTVTGKNMTVGGSTESNAATEIVFDPLVADDEVQTGSLAPSEEIVFGTDSKGNRVLFVEFEYTFTNNGQEDYEATVSITPSTEEDEVTTNVVYEYNKLNEGWVTLPAAEADRTIVVAADGENSFQLRIRVENPAKDASFIGTINWALSVA